MNNDRKVYQKKYHDENKPKYRIYTRNYNNRLRNAVFELLGGKCVNCGFDDKRALQIDHIDGGGNKDKKENTGFYIKRVLDEILSGIHKYQLLCANCNWIKKTVKNETNIIL